MHSLARFSALGTATLACLALAFAPSTAQAVDHGQAGPNAGDLALGCETGPLHGLWKSPGPGSPGMPGKVHGAFLDDGGDTRYLLDAVLLKDPGPAGPALHGRILGKVRSIGADPGEPAALVRGRWHKTEPGQGTFRFVLLVPDATAEHGLRVIGKAKGHFVDPPPASGPPPGVFHGHWILCPDGATAR